MSKVSVPNHKAVACFLTIRVLLIEFDRWGVTTQNNQLVRPMSPAHVYGTCQHGVTLHQSHREYVCVHALESQVCHCCTP
jgi:hypothetical protein